MIEPKACRFCGGAAEIDYMQPFRAYQTGEPLDQPAVYCRDCGAQISHYMRDVGLDRDDTMDLVLAAWNNRAPDPAIDALQAENERLRAMLEWQPMDTLRGDGEVMGYCPDEKHTKYAHVKLRDGKPFVVNNCFHFDRAPVVTHWRHYPDPPSTGGQP